MRRRDAESLVLVGSGAERLRARKLSDNAEAGKARELGRSLSVRRQA